MISIIIPTLNSASNLPVTLKAVFNQTFKDIEIIIVDDGSSDNTREVLQTYRDRTIQIFAEHRGRCAARNTGFRASKGEFIIFLDAAAEMVPTMLSRLYQALQENQQYSFAYSSFKWRWKKFPSFSYDAERLKKMNYIHTSTLIRREHFPGFDETIEKFNDWDLWLTMMERGHYGIYIPEVLFCMRAHGTTASSWLPSVMYKIPWQKLGIHIPQIEKYEKWKKIVQEKHGIDLRY